MHRGAADTKLISVLNQVVCVQGQLDSYLTKDVVSELNGCVLKLQLIYALNKSFFLQSHDLCEASEHLT